VKIKLNEKEYAWMMPELNELSKNVHKTIFSMIMAVKKAEEKKDKKMQLAIICGSIDMILDAITRNTESKMNILFFIAQNEMERLEKIKETEAG
jgi:spore coat polysaccharide biosynthesis predicted glycosyltransferase SpsG